MSGQVLGYARVSSGDQNLDRQLAAIGSVDQVFTDHASGSSRDGREGLEAMRRHVRVGDTVKVGSMDRLARSVVDLAQLVEGLVTKGVRVEFVKERLTFEPAAGDDPFATFQLHILGSVAQLERSLIRERQREGIALAKQRGVYDGRARRLSAEDVTTLRAMDAAGVPRAKIARDLGCSRRLIYDVLAQRGAYKTTSPTRPAMTGGAEEVELPL